MRTSSTPPLPSRPSFPSAFSPSSLSSSSPSAPLPPSFFFFFFFFFSSSSSSSFSVVVLPSPSVSSLSVSVRVVNVRCYGLVCGSQSVFDISRTICRNEGTKCSLQKFHVFGLEVLVLICSFCSIGTLLGCWVVETSHCSSLYAHFVGIFPIFSDFFMRFLLAVITIHSFITTHFLLHWYKQRC